MKCNRIDFSFKFYFSELECAISLFSMDMEELKQLILLASVYINI